MASEKSVKILRYLTHCISTFNFLYFLTALPFASIQNQNKELYWIEFFRPIISHTFFGIWSDLFWFWNQNKPLQGIGRNRSFKIWKQTEMNREMKWKKWNKYPSKIQLDNFQFPMPYIKPRNQSIARIYIWIFPSSQ